MVVAVNEVQYESFVYATSNGQGKRRQVGANAACTVSTSSIATTV